MDRTSIKRPCFAVFQPSYLFLANTSYLPEDEVSEVDALSGSCMMVRKDALERGCHSNPATCPGAGLLDEAFFMYGEDLD